jgi:hypothetical protein
VLYRADSAVQSVYFPLDCVVSILAEAEETLAETKQTAAVEIATVGNEGVVGVSAVLGVPRSFGRTVVQVGGKAIKVSAKKATRLLCEMPLRFQNLSTLHLCVRPADSSGWAVL